MSGEGGSDDETPLPVGEREGPAPQAREGEGPPPSPKTRARELRRNQTPEELALWRALRDRRFDELKWRRQEPVAGYFADFACRALRLIVELDGEQHFDQRAYDDRRTAFLERAGWTVIRFPNGDVKRDLASVLERIADAVRIARTGADPHPPTRLPARGPLPLPSLGEGNSLANPMPLRARRQAPVDRAALARWTPEGDA